MTHFRLAAPIAAALLFKGSMAIATMADQPNVCPAAPAVPGVCRITLAMMTPPPPRPAHITADLAEAHTNARSEARSEVRLVRSSVRRQGIAGGR